jgi:hypothetical protein
MAISLESLTKSVPFTTRSLIDKMRSTFFDLPHSRRTTTRNNLKYTLADTALSAVSVFFTHSLSFLDDQGRIKHLPALM